MSPFSPKTEHRSRGDKREQKVQGPIAVVAPPFPPFPAICSQKRQAIKDRHLLPVSLSLQLSHTNTLLAIMGPKCASALTQACAGTTQLTVGSITKVTAYSSQPQDGHFH